MKRSQLHDYQLIAVEQIIKNPCYALFLEMGLGKTAATLTAISDLFSDFAVCKVLIIAPLRVCLNTWPAEINNWEHTKHLTYSQFAGATPARRAAQLYEDTQIHIINRELVPWLVEKTGKHWPYDMVVIDESSSFKNPASKRFKALKKIRGKIDRVLELTGSPAPNGLIDIYAPVWLLDTGERLGRTLTQYRQRYFNQDYMGWSWTIREGMDKVIYDKIGDITLSMKTTDHLKLPDVVHNTISVKLTPKAEAIYNELEQEMIVQLTDTELTAFNAAALTNKCLQLANGCVYTEAGEQDVHDAKLDALESIINEAEGQSILIAYNFKSDLRRIKKRFNAQDINVEKWNNKEIQIMAVHPASAGHGLNLQKGGRICVWFGLNWSLELYEQFNARLHRQGQTDTVFIHHIVASGTIDEKVMDVLQKKKTVQEALKEATK